MVTDGATGKSLVMRWVEVMLEQLARYSTLPVVSPLEDQQWLITQQRMQRDQAGVRASNMPPHIPPPRT